MTRKNIILTVVAVVVGGLLIGGVLVALFAYVCLHGFTNRPLKPEERAMLVTVDDLAVFGFTNLNTALCEKSCFKRNIEGGRDLEYEYDSDLDPARQEDGTVYISSNTEFAPTTKSARESFGVLMLAYKAGTRLVSGRRVADDKYLSGIGDQVFSGSVVDGTNVVGHVAIVRRGRMVHNTMIIGLHIAEPADWKALIQRPAVAATREGGR